MAYKYKNQLPTQALYYATRLFGSKAKNEKVKKHGQKNQSAKQSVLL